MSASFFLFWPLVLWQWVRREALVGVQRSKHRDVCIGLSGCVLVLYWMTCFCCAVFNLCNFVMHVGLKSSWELMLYCYKMYRLWIKLWLIDMGPSWPWSYSSWGFTTINAISAYHHWCCELDFRSVPRCSSDITICPGPKTRANSFDK